MVTFEVKGDLRNELIFGSRWQKAIIKHLQERFRSRINITFNESLFKMCETCISQKLLQIDFAACYLPESSAEVVSVKCAMLGVCFPYNPTNFWRASQARLTVEDSLPCIFKKHINNNPLNLYDIYLDATENRLWQLKIMTHWDFFLALAVVFYFDESKTLIRLLKIITPWDLLWE